MRIGVSPSTFDDGRAVGEVTPDMMGQVHSPVGGHRPSMGFFGVPNRRRGFGTDGAGPFEIRAILGLARLGGTSPVSRHKKVPLIPGAMVKHSGRLVDSGLIGGTGLTKVLGVKLRHRSLA